MSLFLSELTTGPVRMEQDQYCQLAKVACLSSQNVVPRWELIVSTADRLETQQWQHLDQLC